MYFCIFIIIILALLLGPDESMPDNKRYVDSDTRKADRDRYEAVKAKVNRIDESKKIERIREINSKYNSSLDEFNKGRLLCLIAIVCVASDKNTLAKIKAFFKAENSLHPDCFTKLVSLESLNPNDL